MGRSEGEFDAWLERALERELGVAHRAAPERDWTRGRPRARRRLAGTGGGGGLALKSAAGLVALAVAVALTQGAMTGSAVAWGHAVEVATINVIAPASGTPAGDDGAPAPLAVPAAATGARAEESHESGTAVGSSSHHGETHHGDDSRGSRADHDDHDSAPRAATTPRPDSHD